MHRKITRTTLTKVNNIVERLATDGFNDLTVSYYIVYI